MKKRFLIVDTANTFFRARHSAHRQSDTWDKLGFAIHVTLGSVNKAWRDQKANHVVFCLEGRSWRKDYYEPYKKNRAVARAALTESEQEEDRLFWEAFDNLKTFLAEKTNCTVLQHPELEADDLIAGFIQAHPNDDHVIISSDTDFYQLLAPNVKQYNGVADELHTLEGILDKKGKLVIDKKTKEPKRIAEAFADQHKKGYAWNNLMLQRWTDHNGVEHRVLDDYERNRVLVDLTAQPEEFKAKIQDTIAVNAVKKNRPMVGAQFLKFCGKYELNRLSEHSSNYAELLGAEYPE